MHRLIQNWRDRLFTCAICGTDKSVKYETVVKDINNNDVHIPICNKCAFNRAAICNYDCVDSMNMKNPE